MPRFLTREEVYRLLQRELPDVAYPDGAPSAFYSTADMDATAGTIATAYDNQERIYANYFPHSADEKINDWEITAFGVLQDASLTLAERQDRVTAKIRSRKGLTKTDMLQTVQSVIGTDKIIEIVEWGCGDGGWILDVSLLDYSTILNGIALIQATGPMLCEMGPEDFGLTQAQWVEMQTEAYTYEVLIYGYTLTQNEYDEIHAALNVAEPARSNHVITSGLDPADSLTPP